MWDFFCTFAAAKVLSIMNEIVLYQPNAQFQLEVQLKNETVWLNLQQLSLLFDRDRTVIARHIRNVYTEKELDENITCAKFAHMGSDGDQTYETKYYNLDVIISVGYRVKSQRGVQFRQWATRILKDYMLRGYAVNQRILTIEERVDRRLGQIESTLAQHQEKIDFFVHAALPPVEQVFFEGQFFEARVLLEKLIKMAKKRVIIIDDTLYHCGHSVKDLGKKLSAIMKMDLTPEVILSQVR